MSRTNKFYKDVMAIQSYKKKNEHEKIFAQTISDEMKKFNVGFTV